MIVTTHLKVLGVSLAASILVLGACAPLPPAGGASSALPPPPTAQVAAAKPQPAPRRSAQVDSSGAPGAQRIQVGGPSGYRTEVSITPPRQVCDLDAFADGVQYGYAYTWNRLVMEQARDGGKTTGAPQPQFDPSAIRLQDEQYKIVWNGDQRVNACASDGYLIGRIVGTHQAYTDLKGGAG
ncbi:hypothetical protein [Caballeronia sp. LjRoot31]|uniref:hypothetical protein n=1 Tax=Caballeronia sp. LjRoot31 TaxID=3342324 RepID=UPI003ECC77AA